MTYLLVQIIELPLEGHYYHITEELITLYPIFKENSYSVFEYDD